jgi:hypothetical protein
LRQQILAFKTKIKQQKQKTKQQKHSRGKLEAFKIMGRRV